MAKEAIKTLALAHISRDPRLQMRVMIDKSYVEQLAEVVKEGKGFDGQLPIVYHDGSGNNWLADGFQRFAAHELAEVKKMECLVRSGSFRDAQQFALSANARHGARRTNQDKRKAVETALADEEWGKLSDRLIAEMCGVSNKFVGDIRKSSVVYGTQLNSDRVGRDGKTYNAESNAKKPEPAAGWDDEPAPTEPAKPEADTPVTVQAEGQTEDAEFTVVENQPTEQRKKKYTVGADELNDAKGNPVPERLRDVFGDPWVRNYLADLDKILLELSNQKWVTQLKSKSQRYAAFMRAGDGLKYLAEVLSNLQLMREAVACGVPHTVCSKCQGARGGCDDCRKTGWLPSWREQELHG